MGGREKSREEMRMERTVSRLMYLSATLMFASAVFQIAGDRWYIGVVFFAAGACFTAAAGKQRKKEAEEAKKNQGNSEGPDHVEN